MYFKMDLVQTPLVRMWGSANGSEVHRKKVSKRKQKLCSKYDKELWQTRHTTFYSWTRQTRYSTYYHLHNISHKRYQAKMWCKLCNQRGSERVISVTREETEHIQRAMRSSITTRPWTLKTATRQRARYPKDKMQQKPPKKSRADKSDWFNYKSLESLMHKLERKIDLLPGIQKCVLFILHTKVSRIRHWATSNSNIL